MSFMGDCVDMATLFFFLQSNRSPDASFDLSFVGVHFVTALLVQSDYIHYKIIIIIIAWAKVLTNMAQYFIDGPWAAISLFEDGATPASLPLDSFAKWASWFCLSAKSAQDCTKWGAV